MTLVQGYTTVLPSRKACKSGDIVFPAGSNAPRCGEKDTGSCRLDNDQFVILLEFHHKAVFRWSVQGLL